MMEAVRGIGGRRDTGGRPRVLARDTYRRSAVQGTDSSSELSLGERIVVTSIAGQMALGVVAHSRDESSAVKSM